MTLNETTSEPAAPVSIERLAYNKKELGQALGICPTSLWRLEKKGLLTPLPGIRHKLYSVSAVKRFLAGGDR